MPFFANISTLNEKTTQALKDYRELIRLLARDATLSDAQLAALDLCSEELDLTDDDRQADVSTLNRYWDVEETLTEAKARAERLQTAIAEAEQTIERCIRELDEAKEARQDAKERLELVQVELNELATIEGDNPRLFIADD